MVAVMSMGLATGFALVAAPQYGASELVLASGLALLVGLVLGAGLAFLLGYLNSGRRSPKQLRQRPNPEPILFRIIRKRLWLILLVMVVSAGITTGFSLVTTAEYEAPIFLLTLGLAPIAGLVLGVGLAFLLEYLSNGRRSPKVLREEPDPRSTAQESSRKESSES